MSKSKSREQESEAEYHGEITYIVRSGSIVVPGEDDNLTSADGVTYKKGEPIEPNEHMLENMRHKLLAVSEDGYLVDHTVDRELTPEEKVAKKYREEHLGGESE